VDWIGLAQDKYKWRAFVDAGNEISCSIKCWELPSDCTTCGLSSDTHLHTVRYICVCAYILLYFRRKAREPKLSLFYWTKLERACDRVDSIWTTNNM
jgi:hypothetical protein